MTNSLQDWLSGKQQEWEDRCCQCGACCGATEDPCENLVITADGKSQCRVYAERFDHEHHTVSGAPLRCVPIRNKIHTSWPGDLKCGYKRPES